MPLNLEPMRRFAEGEMVDTLLVERDPEGYRDNTFDEVTGTYEPPPLTQIYQGKGMVIVVTSSPTEEPEGGGEGRYTRYMAMVPLSSDPIQVYDTVTLVNCVRDPDLNGAIFRVESVNIGTFSVMRQLELSFRDFTSNI